MRILFATAELAPLVRVGGLAEAAGGLTQALRRAGADVDVVVPDYFGAATVLADQVREVLDVPEWAAPASARTGSLEGFGTVTLVDVPGIERPHPYLQTGSAEGWEDNDKRFLAFSAAIAALARARKVDVLHANDWHTGASLALCDEGLPTVVSIHNLAYQGWCHPGWLDVLGPRSRAYLAHDRCNPLHGAITLADRIVAVSPNYADEILRPADGMGLDALLRHRSDALVGILNGIDTAEWNPAADPHLPAPYRLTDLRSGDGPGKQACRRALRAETGLDPDEGPLIGMVTRLVDQKGVDLALEAAALLPDRGAQLVVLGSGDPALAARWRELATARPGRLAFHEGFDLGFAHRVFAGSDLYLMPSRFEPCGLAQMQAMAYGAIPVVTDVGGLHDTVIDADADPERGNGFVSPVVSGAGVVDALHRSARAWAVKKRRAVVIRNGMSHDWSWDGPAQRYLGLYRDLAR